MCGLNDYGFSPSDYCMIINLIQLMDFISCSYVWGTSSREC